MAQPHEIRRRRELAANVAGVFAGNPDVAAVLLAGSVPRGLADEFSDVEVDVYWRTPPSDDDRRAVWADNGWPLVATDVDEHEWADSFLVEGVKVDTSQFLVETLDRFIDSAMRDADTEPEYQVRITAIRDGVPLHGAPVIEGWRSRTEPYPDALGQAMVRQGLDVWPRMRLEMLAARDDVLLLRSDVVDVIQGVLSALFGLNRRFAPHPWHKWLDWETSLFGVAPDGLNRRIREILTARPPVAVVEVSRLVHETFDLVDQELPDLDTTALRRAFDARRVVPIDPG